jgi:hypothetical protein
MTFKAKVDAYSSFGAVAFWVDGKAVVGVGIDNDGQAIASFRFTAGTHFVGASYVDSSFPPVYDPATAAPLTVTIAKGPTFVNNPISTAQIGQPVTLNSYVYIPGGVVTGAIAFADAANHPLPGCAALSPDAGFAHCTTTFPTQGTFPITVSYAGDANTQPSSGVMQVTVGKAAASVYLATAPDAPVYGQPASISALVLGAQNVAAPSGTVTAVLCRSRRRCREGAAGRVSCFEPHGAGIWCSGDVERAGDGRPRGGRSVRQRNLLG